MKIKYIDYSIWSKVVPSRFQVLCTNKCMCILSAKDKNKRPGHQRPKATP